MNLANIRVEPCMASWNGADLGYTDGDIEIKLEEQSVDVTAHQEGTNVLDSIRTGKSVEISLTLKETSVEQVKALLEVGGGSVSAEAQVTAITAVASPGSALNSKYMRISSANGSRYAFWFNVATTGVAPVLPGYTVVAVALTVDATAEAVATALANALDLSGAFSTSMSALDNVIWVTDTTVGHVMAAPDMGNTGMAGVVSVAGTSVMSGWGSSKDFTGMHGDSHKLVLHPVAKDNADLSSDVAFWKAYPQVNSIVKSGENPQTVAVSFKIFPDMSKSKAIRLFAVGAHE